MSPSDASPSDDTTWGLLLPGGQVDPDKLRQAWLEAEDDERSVPIRFRLLKDVGTRLDRYITQRLGFMSRTQVQRLIEGGDATINHKPARASTKLRLGDLVELHLPPPPSKEIRAEDIAIDVLYEDEHLVVLDKQPGIIVHPARGELGGTLLNALAWHFEHRSSGTLSAVGQDKARPGVVHRLDRDTTGCIVFAKDEEAHWKLGAQFERRTVDKRYLALVHGRIEEPAGVIDLPLGPHPSRAKGYREKIVVRHDDLGKASVTICRVRERYRLHDQPVNRQHFTLAELELKTGRTHQIRVHLSHTGYPIVGDAMYEGRPFASGGVELLVRQALHATMLAFEHPITGAPMRFAAPLPSDVSRVIASLRAHGQPESLTPAGSTIDLDEAVGHPA